MFLTIDTVLQKAIKQFILRINSKLCENPSKLDQLNINRNL